MSYIYLVFICRIFGYIYIYMYYVMIYNYLCGNRLIIEI